MVPFFRPPRTHQLVLTLVALIVLLAAVLPLPHAQRADAAAPCPADNRHLVPAHGGRWLLAGANVPWLGSGFGADFATVEEWGQHTYSSAAAEQLFADVRVTGANTVRWWVFADGRGAPEFAAPSGGAVTGFDATTLPSLADAVRLAEQHDVYLVFTLWSFDMLFADGTPRDRGEHAGGHRDLIVDRATRRSFLDQALLPMLRYPVPGTSHTVGTHPNVLGWEVINEPEWGIWEANAVDGRIPQAVSLAEMQRFVAEVAGAIHRNSAQLVTVGSASLKWNSDRASGAQGNFWSDAALTRYDPDGALNFYQIHYYPWMDGNSQWTASPLRVDWASAGFDKPVVVGEFPATGIGDPQAFLDTLDRNCYAGGWGWSYAGVDTSGSWEQLRGALTSFSATRQERLRIGSPSEPPSTSPTAAPSATPAPSPSTTVLYDDRLAAGWQDWSWSSQVDTQAVVPGQSGSAALSVTYLHRGGGLKLHAMQPLAVNPNQLLRFRVHGGQGGARLQLELRHGNTTAVAPTVIEPTAGQWSVVALPLSRFTPVPTHITDFVIRDVGGALGTVSFDQLQRVAVSEANPAPTSSPSTSPTGSPSETMVSIYTDALASGWRDNGWGVTTDLAATAERHSGSYALAARFTTGWGAVRFTRTAPLPRTGLTTLRLALHGGPSGGQRLRVILQPSRGATQHLATVSLVAGQWRVFDLPLPTAATLPDLAALIFQEDSGVVPAPFVLDDIALLGGGASGPTPMPTSPPLPSPTATTPSPPTATSAPWITGRSLRVMPLGDSITEGVNGGYRNRLWERLAGDGISVDYVGPRWDRWTRIADKDHAGTPGFTVGNLLGEIDGWLSTYRPDVVLLMIGTNDLAWWHVEGPTTTATRLGTLLDRIHARAPGIRVVVATIPPMAGPVAPNRLDRAALVAQYNDAVEQEVARRVALGRPLSLADVNAALRLSDLYDGVHPTEAAHARIADVWYAALPPAVR